MRMMLKLLMLFLMTLNVLAWPRWAALSPVKVGEELRDGAAVLGWMTKLTTPLMKLLTRLMVAGRMLMKTEME